MSAPAHGSPASVLAGVATPDLYRGNAFRLSGLPVDASAREVRRRVTELEAGERLGADWVAPPSPGRPSPDPDRAEVHHALQRLRDPARRIVDELFWLWPMPGGIGGADITEAFGVWTAAIAGGDREARAVALHNRAVATHAEAVEVDTPDAERHADLWRAAYRRWHQVLAEDACWDHLRERVEAIGDPRVSIRDVENLRDRLAQGLLTLHARLAVEAVLTSAGGARRHLRALHGSGFDERLVDTVLRAAVETHAAHVRTAVERLRADRADHHETVARTLAVADGEDLRVLRTILGDEDDLATAVADELASCVRECVVAELNGNRDEHPAVRATEIRNNLAHLEAALELAVGTSTRTHIEQDLVIVLNNLVVAMCDEALEDGEAWPVRGHELQDRLVEETRDHVARIAALDPDAGCRTRDDVVGTSLVLLFKYVTETRDVQLTIDALRDLKPNATAPELRTELADAIRSLLTARQMYATAPAPHMEDLRALRGRRGPCVLCGHHSTALRRVFLRRPDGRHVAVPVSFCTVCSRRSISTRAHRVIAGTTMTFAFALALVGGIATGFNWDGLLGWICSLVAVAAVSWLLSWARRSRQSSVAEHPDVEPFVRHGYRIDQ